MVYIGNFDENSTFVYITQFYLFNKTLRKKSSLFF